VRQDPPSRFDGPMRSARTVTGSGVAADPSVFGLADGFSISAAMMAHLPGVSGANIVSPLEIERSLGDDSPTILLAADTGERVPHFSELDLSRSANDKRVLLVRPVVPLQRGTRYIVALRGLVDQAGAPWAPSEPFVALRDGVDSAEPSVEQRRGLYADIFARLADAGIARGDLQLAWDFTTAGEDNITGWMVAMRDDAFDVLGDAGPQYTSTTKVAPNKTDSPTTRSRFWSRSRRRPNRRGCSSSATVCWAPGPKWKRATTKSSPMTMATSSVPPTGREWPTTMSPTSSPSSRRGGSTIFPR